MQYVSNSQIQAWYGAPCHQPIVPIRVSGSDVPLNKKCKRLFLFFDLCFKTLNYTYWANDLKEKQLDTWGYVCRVIAGTSTYSKHSWGIAIDLDSDENAQGTPKYDSEIWRKGERSVRMLQKCGFTWGGHFGVPDPHHFEVAVSRRWILARFDRKGRPRKWFAKKVGWKGAVSNV